MRAGLRAGGVNEGHSDSTPAYGLGRLFQAVPVAPPWLGLALAAGLVAVFLVSELALGRFEILFSPDAPTGMRGDFRIAIVLLCMLAYLPTARELALRGFQQNLVALRPVLACGPAEFEALLAQVGRHDRRPLLWFGALGIVLALGVPILTNLSLNAYDLTHIYPEPTWHRFVTPLIGWLLVSFLYVILLESRRFSRVGRDLVVIELLEQRPLAPFVRQGLRNAFLATGLLALAALLVIDVENAPGFVWLLIGLYAIVIALAAAGLVLPVRGVHQSLQQHKQAELAWCSAEIRRARERLATNDEKTASRLADLVAWRSLVASAPEWPFDTPTLLRFALYLAIPLGSWLGGAVVERLVDATIG